MIVGYHYYIHIEQTLRTQIWDMNKSLLHYLDSTRIPEIITIKFELKTSCSN
jgi:hypothetical protein